MSPKSIFDGMEQLFVYRENTDGGIKYGYSCCTLSPAVVEPPYAGKETSSSHGDRTVEELVINLKGILRIMMAGRSVRPEIFNGFPNSRQRIDASLGLKRDPLPQEEMQRVWQEIQRIYPLE